MESNEIASLDLNGRTVAGVVFDVDGTLYSQAPLRFLMAIELVFLPVRLCSLAKARRIWRIISVFRNTREEIRTIKDESTPLSILEYDIPARSLNIPVDEVRAVVEEWMYRRPLKYLALCRRRHLVELLKKLSQRSIPVGVLSDYPADAKLRALGVGHFVDMTLCSTDERIDAFKPAPRGFLAMADLLNLPPSQVLYVGDRPELDGVGGRAASMPVAIVGGAAARSNDLGPGVIGTRSFKALAQLLGV